MRKSSQVLLAVATAFAGLGTGFAQTSSSTPDAFVYVQSSPANDPSTYRIYGFSAAANGALSPIPGSPFISPVSDFALNGKYLFGGYSNAGSNNAIYTYSIAPNGSLRQADFLGNLPIDEPIADFTLDHTGSSLYAGYGEGDTAPTGYESFSINQTNGKLTPLNVQQTGGVDDYGFIYFTGNNQYVYGADCYHFSPSIYGFARLPNGALSRLGMSAPLPAASSSYGYCPDGAVATDPYNDVVIALARYSYSSTNPGGPQLAVYTADKYGNLSTTSTSGNMPTPQVSPDFVSMSPKGYYLVVTGSTGMQVFLMHGSKPLTALTGKIMPGVPLGRAFWDNHEHLYVLAPGKVYVFNISTHGVTQAPGSPHLIPSPNQIAVLPK